MLPILLGLILLLLHLVPSLAFHLAAKPVSQLLTDKAYAIASLKGQASDLGIDLSREPYSNDVFFLRYCLKDEEDAASRLESNIKWRQGPGKLICDAAQRAIVEATKNGGWDNGPVLEAAPNSDKIRAYLKPSNIITTTTSTGDLVTCIRAGAIDDVSLMKAVSVDEMVDFFIYAREVNAAVCNTRSLHSDRLCCLLACNSLDGVKLVGGDATFRSALGQSSKQADPLYPNLSGPTLLLNLPPLLGALVKLFTPLFPPAVKERLRFEQGPLKDVDDLLRITVGGDKRKAFLADLDARIYKEYLS